MSDIFDWNDLPGQSYISADSTHITNCLVGIQATIDRDNMRKPIPQTFNYIKGGKGDKDITADESLQAGIMELLDGADTIASDTASAPEDLEAKSLELLNGFARTAKNANVDQHSIHEEPTKDMFKNYIQTEPARADMPISPGNPIRIFGKPIESGKDAHRLVRGIKQSMEPRNLAVTLDQANHSLTFYPEPDACAREAARRLCKDPEAYDRCLAVYRDVSAQEIRNADDAELAGTRKKDAVDADIYHRMRDMKDSFGASRRDLELHGGNVHGKAVPVVKALNKEKLDEINNQSENYGTKHEYDEIPERETNVAYDDVLMSRFLGLLATANASDELNDPEIIGAIGEFFETGKMVEQMKSMSECKAFVQPGHAEEFEGELEPAVRPNGSADHLCLDAVKNLVNSLSSLDVNSNVGKVSDHKDTETMYDPKTGKLKLFGREIASDDDGREAHTLMTALMHQAEPQLLEENLEILQKLDLQERVDRTLFRPGVDGEDPYEKDKMQDAADLIYEFTK